ncbi:MAG: hypothetical protein AAGF12_02050 [Myxococcota bacterium]
MADRTVSTPDATARPDGSVPVEDADVPDGDPPTPDATVDAMPRPTTGFVEVDGLVSMEAEHYTMQTNTERLAVEWYTFAAGAAPPMVTCVTGVTCNNGNRPDCNQYDECDPDEIDPNEAAGNAYVEALPDRRRTDHEPGTGNIGVVNNPEQGPTLHYEVTFTQTGRYYVWARARGQGPAANGIHVGIDGTWPRNELIDPSSMRMQFPGGWRWTQNRRGGNQHTGVSAGNGVSRRDANIWIEVDTPGMHVIQFAMREDGLEFDKIVMALDPDFEPENDGPPETVP